MIRDNYQLILENIEKACRRVRRKPSEVQVLAVCKDQPLSRIRDAYACQIRLMGENRLQEAETHMADLAALNIEWHFIGKLQKNKINKILSVFNFIESVDGVKALEHIHKRVESETELFIEINIDEEKSKSGFTIDGLRKALQYIANLNKVKITGLMTIPPFVDDPEAMRTFFSRMRALKDEINQQRIPNFQIRHLSMGMSHDYEIAVEEGATIVRIGTALFSRRSR